jgi:hypothetical protein
MKATPLFIAGLLVATVLVCAGENYTIDWYKIAGGGGTSTVLLLQGCVSDRSRFGRVVVNGNHEPPFSAK